MKILAIETSCDETAAAVVSYQQSDYGLQQNLKSESRSLTAILSNVVASQIDLHKKFGGVYPEIASRAHAEQIIPVIQESLQTTDDRLQQKTEVRSLKADSSLNDIDIIAVTTGPGLIGSLLVGVNAAKTLAFANNLPIIPINHWLGHIYSTFGGKITNNQDTIFRNTEIPRQGNLPITKQHPINNNQIPKFPLLALIVSGGHTGLVFMKSHTEYETIGQTLDDAAGEAFDKVAKLLGLDYPGGPAISEAAARYRQSDYRLQQKSEVRSPIADIKFPRAMLDRDNYNFSFSGLKTSVLYKVKELTTHYPLSTFRSQVAYEFQSAVIDILIGKTLKAAAEFKPKSICLCGGVSANKELREQMAEAVLSFRTGGRQDPESRFPMSSATRLENDKISFFIPPIHLTGDNAAMIGLAAAYQINNGVEPTTFDKIDANPNLKL